MGVRVWWRIRCSAFGLVPVLANVLVILAGPASILGKARRGVPPEAVTWRERGLALDDNSNEEARCYESAVKVAPSYREAWFNLGYVRLNQRLWVRAAEGFRQVVELDPDDLEARFNLGLCLMELGGHRYEVRQHLNRVAEGSPGPVSNLSAKERSALKSLAARAQGLVLKIEESIQQALGKVPDYTGASVASMADQLTRGIKRGQSPYAGPRIPLTVQFETSSDQILPVSVPVLRRVAQALSRPDLGSTTISVEGHADSRGPSEYNRRLSQRRARSVKAFLESSLAGTTVRLTVVGHGEGRPLGPNTTADGMARNRRVEFLNQEPYRQLRENARSKRGAQGEFDDLY